MALKHPKIKKMVLNGYQNGGYQAALSKQVVVGCNR
jgi:hypothetical protein